jgi:hypothetical protein
VSTSGHRWAPIADYALLIYFWFAAVDRPRMAVRGAAFAVGLGLRRRRASALAGFTLRYAMAGVDAAQRID